VCVCVRERTGEGVCVCVSERERGTVCVCVCDTFVRAPVGRAPKCSGGACGCVFERETEREKSVCDSVVRAEHQGECVCV